MTINKDREKNVKEIKKKTGNASDITYKDYPVDKKIITFIYSNSVSSQSDINDFILSNNVGTSFWILYLYLIILCTS